MLARVKRLAGSSLADAFELRVELQRFRQRTWCTEYEPLYPGYLFLQPASLDAFEEALKLSTEYARLLRVGENAAPLTPEESRFVRALADAGHVIRMSQAVLEAGNLRVIAGPLRGRERLVHDYNRRKRMAWLSTGFHRAGVTRVGLDITSKT